MTTAGIASLDSVALLIRPSKPIVEGVALAIPHKGCWELRPTEGARHLRRAAESEDAYAMERLGLRLIHGDGMERNVAEGIVWLTRSAEHGNVTALYHLASHAADIDTSNIKTNAERWLRAALKDPAAAIALTYALRNDAIQDEHERIVQQLKVAALSGNQLAHVKLGVYCLAGWGIAQNREDGLAWLRRLGATSPSQISDLGIYLYMKSLAASGHSARALAEESCILFHEAVQQGCDDAKLRLAYVLRRGEVADSKYPSVSVLLSEHIRQNNSFALANLALQLAAGTQCRMDWATADDLMAALPEPEPLLTWWASRAEEGDSEGHLVVGWLCRHKLAVDPERKELPRRIQFARRGHWAAPEWMEHFCHRSPTLDASGA